MVSKIALLLSFVLASAALAAPSSRLEARLARRANRQSKPINLVDASSGATYDHNWAGAVLDKNEGTFATVTGTFTVPTPTGPDGSAFVWVGIDGASCTDAILQTGIEITISNGEVSYGAWYEWYPDYAYDFNDITINSGDQIRATVTASSPTSGTAVIENLTSGQTATQKLSSSSSLCEQNAEWIVEDYTEDGSLVPFVDFGTVEFTDATASGPSGSYNLDGATIVDIEQNNQVLTSSSARGDSLTITYV